MKPECERRLGNGTADEVKQGFFIPYRYIGSVAPAGQRPPYRAIETLFQQHSRDFTALLDDMGFLADEFRQIARDEPPPRPRWGQDWFPRLDAAVTFYLVARRRPARIVEVGSGHSSRFIAHALRICAIDAAHILIDPAPRAPVGDLGARHIAMPLPSVGPAPFANLAAGDILFIDSSHILMPGNDVDYILNHILPGLPAGILIHFHDVFLPDDYPLAWSWRGYNEQTALPALLLSGAYRPLWASHFAATRLESAISGSIMNDIPLMPGAVESSLWLEKTAPKVI